MSQTAVLIAALSITINVLVVPLTLWLAAPGLKIRLMRWQMRSGRKDASLFLYKNNKLDLKVSTRDGSRVRISGGSYASTPEPNLVYRFFGIPVRLRRDNDPEDVNLWGFDNSSNLTAKELDNMVSEAGGEGLAAILKQYFPVAVLVVALLALFAIGSIYLQYVNYESLKEAAPQIAKLLPDSLALNP